MQRQNTGPAGAAQTPALGGTGPHQQDVLGAQKAAHKAACRLGEGQGPEVAACWLPGEAALTPSPAALGLLCSWRRALEVHMPQAGCAGKQGSAALHASTGEPELKAAGRAATLQSRPHRPASQACANSPCAAAALTTG
ncbi:hypothetical protein MMC29_000024 [Sticta canariensis]|nr:hypothetical protein [Sticta canariensis]